MCCQMINRQTTLSSKPSAFCYYSKVFRSFVVLFNIFSSVVRRCQATFIFQYKEKRSSFSPFTANYLLFWDGTVSVGNISKIGKNINHKL